MQPLLVLVDDGLVTPEVGDWAEEKYQLVRCYATIFTNAMRKRWECLVYIDLFAGAGRSRIRGTTRIVSASPLVVLDIPKPFDKYLYCELDSEQLTTLEARVRRDNPNRDATFVLGDCNKEVKRIVDLIPAHSTEFRVLTFCFADPFSLSNLKFETIKTLATDRAIDFLVLIPSGMDAMRNVREYPKPTSKVAEDFLGSRDWRNDWSGVEKRGVKFGDFVVDQFGKEMQRLGYIYDGLAGTQLIRSTERNLALYRLAFFSRHPLGTKFWEQCREYSRDQRKLF